MKFGDVSLNIKTGQDTLGEYDVTVNEEAKEVACWIASEVGAEFSISVDNGLAAHGLHCQVKVDGRSTHPTWVHPEKSTIIQGASVAADVVLPLLFSPIQLTDDENARRDIPTINALGSIQVLLRRGVVNKITPWESAMQTTLTNLGPLHERTKKAGVHCITLGDRRTVKTMRSVYADYIDKPDAPYCTFLFRYRPRDILQAQGIIPIQPIPPAPEADEQQGGRDTVGKRRRNSKEPGDSEVKEESDDEDGGDEDPDALQARLDAMSADMEALRAQMSQAKNKRERKRVKREPSPIRLETSGAVIDLTLD